MPIKVGDLVACQPCNGMGYRYLGGVPSICTVCAGAGKAAVR